MVLGAGQVLQHPVQQFTPAPNAALLIDFDNVTMSIRSDLGKELKTLLKSEVIRGKVAVQRAYADWRRYPQYIVPLTESSVDLIFAPAYGSSKKNATDLRMAIDAIELVFTRPEIGTFILMTGDSDFSSCVLKLKEYGKYVIGVGMRESSSDLLIQNCDEYYSYHSISGLTKAGEVVESTEDPWALVRRAVQRMVKDGDVMRTDRLKQVMIDLDPGFDEKKVGYSKFSRFVSEAASKGVIQLRKAANGQFEILPEDAADDATRSREQVVERIVAEAAEAAGNGRRGRRGRGRDDRREGRHPREPRPIAGETEVAVEPPALVEPEAVEPVEVVEAVGVEGTPVSETTVVRERPAESVDETARVPADEAARQSALDESYSLLQEAVRRLGARDGKAIRDGDVKRKMLEIDRGFDEASLGFAKFTRFLRQAHDAEVIDLNRAGAGNYEVMLPAGGKKLPPPRVKEVPAGSADRARTPDTAREAVTVPAEVASEAVMAPPTESGELNVEVPEARPATPAERPFTATKRPEVVSAVSAPPTSPAVPSAPAADFGALRGRRGGRGAPSGPPPILPGQGVPSTSKPSPLIVPDVPTPVVDTVPPAEPVAVEAAPAETGETEKGKGRSRRGRRGRGGRETVAAAAPEGADSFPTISPAAAAAAADSASETTGETPSESAAETPAAPVTAPSDGTETTTTAPSSRGKSRGRRGRRTDTDAEGSTDAKKAARDTSVSVQTGVEAPSDTGATERSTEAAAEKADGKPVTRGSGRGRGRAAATRSTAPAREAATAASAPVTTPSFSAVALGLPGSLAEITTYLGTKYKGIGKKTAETLVERFGERIFDVLREHPEEIRTVLDERRAGTLLEQWTADYESRVAAATPPAESAAGDEPAPSTGKPRARRGGGRKPAAKKSDS